MPSATWEHSSHARFLSSGMPMTVQHFVHEPQDLPGTVDGLNAAFQSSPEWPDAAGTGAPARSAFLRLASPMPMIPTIECRLRRYIVPGRSPAGEILASSGARCNLAP